MGAQTYLDNYSPVGDITVMVMCLAIFALLFSNLLLTVVYIVSLLELQGTKKRHIMSLAIELIVFYN